MNVRNILILCILLAGFLQKVQGMVFDNRYFPLIQEPYITVSDRPSHLRADLFFTTGDKANSIRQTTYIGIPDMFGKFDLALLGRAFAIAGLPNPLTPILTAATLPYNLEGKLQTQGISFSYQQQLTHHLSAGFYLMVMQSNSSLNFSFQNSNSTVVMSQSDTIALNATLRQMLSSLGLTCNYVRQSGFGDIDAFLRIGDRWEYLFKFRAIEAGLKLGVLFPSGVQRNIFEPASVPFGGNGYWGLYASLDAEFEVREDWKAGVLVRVSKRLPGTHQQRMPAALEQPLFGVLTGSARVNPGFTGIFCPYIAFENLREGLGLRAEYALIAHQQDTWQACQVNGSVAPNVAPWQGTSGWASEDIILTGFYDFGKMKLERCREPIILMSWYIPVALLVASNSVRSYKVSLGVEYNF